MSQSCANDGLLVGVTKDSSWRKPHSLSGWLLSLPQQCFGQPLPRKTKAPYRRFRGVPFIDPEAVNAGPGNWMPVGSGLREFFQQCLSYVSEKRIWPVLQKSLDQGPRRS